MADASHILCTIPPGTAGDPVLRTCSGAAGARALAGLSLDDRRLWRSGRRVGSTRTRPPRPASRAASRGWRPSAPGRRWGWRPACAVDIFRLPGIYGPGRSAIDQVKAGTARRIDKPGQVFSRIHVEDIAGTVLTGDHRAARRRDLQRGRRPAGVERRCRGLRLRAAGQAGCRPLIPWEQAEPAMSAMARSFYAESRRVRNDRIKNELGVVLRYPTYREGLRAIAVAHSEPASSSTVAIRRAMSAGRAESMVAALDQGGDHLRRLEMPGDLQGIFPRHVGIALAVQQAHRTGQRQLLVEQEMVAALLDQLPGEDRRLGRILRRPLQPAVALELRRDPSATGPSAACAR